MKIILGVLCFGIGIAFVVGAVHALVRPGYSDNVLDAAFPAMFGAMLLLGSFLLLRRSPSSRNEEVEAEMKAMLDEWKKRRGGG